jgi:hypothetical protein
MSAFGTKRTWQPRSSMSAFGGKADIDWTERKKAPADASHWRRYAVPTDPPCATLQCAIGLRNRDDEDFRA